MNNNNVLSMVWNGVVDFPGTSVRKTRQLVRLVLLLSFLLISPCSFPATYVIDTSSTAPITGLWWNSLESGWGVTLTQQYEIIFVTIFTYDANGLPIWYVASNCAISGKSCSGELYKINGGTIITSEWDGSARNVDTVGTISFTFTDDNTGTMNFTIDGVSGSKAITRQVWSTLSPGAAMTALWWNELESGWGVTLTQQTDIAFATMFTYDSNGFPTWYVASNCAVSGNGCTGTLYEVTGGSSLTQNWDGANLILNDVGSVTFDFSDIDNGTMAFTINGLAGDRVVSRQIWATDSGAEDDVASSSAKLIKVYSGTTTDASDQDIVAIDMIANLHYRVAMSPAESTTDASYDTMIIDILDPQGISLGVSDDDSGSGFASTLVFTPAESGTYSIIAGQPGPNSLGGTFDLQVSELTIADDFSNALNDTNVICVWETQDASIEQSGDTDTIAIWLEAGTPVDITVYGNDNGLFGELINADILSFTDASEDPIDPALFDLVEGFGNFIVAIKQITFTPTVTGTYFLTIGAASGTGDYSVSIAEQDKGIYGIRAHEKFVFTGKPEIDSFFDPQSVDFFKNDEIIRDRNDDGITTLTYSLLNPTSQFSDAFHNPIASAATVNFAPASGVVLDTFLSVMEQVGSFANIQFVEVPDVGAQAGNFRMGFSGLRVGGPGFLANGWSGFPRWGELGETWINPTQAALNIQGTTINLDEFLVNRTLHEFSHNLGLAHPDRSPNFASGIDTEFTGQEYSVMSRTSSGTFPEAYYGDMQPQTQMWFDIQAIQAAYGINTTATSGNNTYSFDTGARHFSTLWDYGGDDTLVLIGSADVVIDLTPGTWQDVGTSINYFGDTGIIGTRKSSVFITPDTIIENVVADTGNDMITGNDADNQLSGNAGDDILIGGPGDDTLTGGNGVDTFRYLSVADGNDVINDFATLDDVINLDQLLDALEIAPIARRVVLMEDGGGNTLINIDTNGDGIADNPEFSILLMDVIPMDLGADVLVSGRIILSE